MSFCWPHYMTQTSSDNHIVIIVMKMWLLNINFGKLLNLYLNVIKWSRTCQLCYVGCLARRNSIARRLTQHNGQGFDHSSVHQLSTESTKLHNLMGCREPCLVWNFVWVLEVDCTAIILGPVERVSWIFWLGSHDSVGYHRNAKIVNLKSE